MLVVMSQLENKFLHVSYCIISAAPDLSPSVAVTFFCFLTMETKNDIYLALGVHVFQLVYNIKKVKPGNKSPGGSTTNMQPKHHCSFFNHNFMTSLKLHAAMQ
jgi:hypothetical protein